MEIASAVLSARPPFFFLEDAANQHDKVSVICRSVAVFGQKSVESAGAAFQRRANVAANRVQKINVRINSSASGSSAEEMTPSDALIKDVDAVSLANVDHDNYYELLGLGAVNVNATDDQIRKVFRKLVLKLHPDKTPTPGATPSSPAAKKDGTDPADVLFLALQKAYDNLSNPVKRRAYDSRYAFEEAIPSGNEKLAPVGLGYKAPHRGVGDFYQTYGPVFDRNSRFSERLPVPKLGGPATPIEDVDAFYAFWFTFESWREYTGSSEHDLNGAEYREEKRWMQRENKKDAVKWKKTEMARVADLVTRAYARDPRIVAKKVAEESAKKAAYESKNAAKAKAEFESKVLTAARAGMEAAELESGKYETIARRVAREKEKRQFKGAQKRLREACAKVHAEGSAVAGDLEWYFTQVDAATLWPEHAVVFHSESKELDFEGKADGKALAALLTKVVDLRKSKLAWYDKAPAASSEESNTPISPVAAAASLAPAVKKEKPEWTPAELSSLAKAVAKYPGGARNRWKMVSDLVNHLGLAWSRSPDECIARAAKLANDVDATKSTQSAFAQSQEVVKHRTGMDAKEMGAADAAAARLLPPVAHVVDDGLGPDEEGDGPLEAPWTPEQQAALEVALRKYPANNYEKAERWKLVAADVPEKSKKQCFARFKEVREKLLASKKK